MVLYLNDPPALDGARGSVQANTAAADVMRESVLLEVVSIAIHAADPDLQTRRVSEITGFNGEFRQHT